MIFGIEAITIKKNLLPPSSLKEAPFGANLKGRFLLNFYELYQTFRLPFKFALRATLREDGDKGVALVVLTAFLLFFQPIIADVDFDISMKTAQYQQVIASAQNKDELGLSGTQLMDFFRNLYEKNKPSRCTPSVTIKIPKIIHQIWIGKSVPEEFNHYQFSWRAHHPDWQYKLWTQDDIADLNMHNAELVRESRNPAEISDLMRYEILYRYGGVYVDFDFACLKSLESLHYLYDFYIGIQPLDSELVQLGIGLIGSIPGHPLLKSWIERVKETWYNKNVQGKITARTGPIHCTKVFYDTAGRGTTCDIALPASYFYPLGCQEYDIQRGAWLQEGAFAVHYWAKSWLYPAFRRSEFQNIKNY
ncbi:MAG: glycosyltransferase [Candidatus Dependentiae bacterium]|nr:glycosyltransferase [Candidatus Dependentiae bacterium]